MSCSFCYDAKEDKSSVFVNFLRAKSMQTGEEYD